MKKKIVSIMLSFVMMCAVAPCIAMAAETANGAFGDDAAWTLDDSGTLTISGTGSVEISKNDDIMNYTQNVKKVVIGSGITSVDFYSLKNAEELTTVEISETVTECYLPYTGCPKFTDINVNASNETYSSDGGILFNKAKTQIITYPAGKTQTSYDVPVAVTDFAAGAFMNCTSLVNITLPDGITELKWDLFNGCTALENVSLPDSITKIGESAFYKCTSLTSINIPSGVTSIEDATFQKCSALESISIPEGVTSIGSEAFSGCGALEKIYIPNSLSEIEENAFFKCYELDDVYYNGTEDEWNKIDISSTGNNLITKYVDIHYDPKPWINGTPQISKDENTYTAVVPIEHVKADCTLIAVLYKDKVMQSVNAQAIPLDSTSETISVSADNADEIKLFIWDSLSGVRALCGGYSKNFTSQE